MRTAFIAACLLLAATGAAAQEPDPPAPPAPAHEEHVEVVGVTPIHGLGLPRTKLPSNIQVFRTADAPADAMLVPSSFLGERAAGVQVNETQGSSLQAEVLFRGFVGSPVLGSSEGLAVYVNGVRMNEPFGDTVAWDVLPAAAVSSINIIPGSNPLFGLNALGGAVSMRTKDGFEYPRARVAFTTGAFGRHWVEAEGGAHGESVGLYVSGTLSDENGWREFSPSTIRRALADLAWRGRASSLNVTLMGASNDLSGNGPAPVGLLDRQRDAVFTHPDTTSHDAALLTVRGRRAISANTLVEAVGYHRRNRIGSFNGDAADVEDAAQPEGGLDAEGSSGRLPFDAINNTGTTKGRGVGMSGQITRTGPLGGRENYLIVGAGIDAAGTRYASAVELAHLTDDRGTIGSGIYDDAEAVDLHTRTATGSLFLTDTWSATARLAATGSARVNWTHVRLRDRLGTALDGDHAFVRVNPSGGVTYQATPRVNVYGSYAQSSRVPSPVELTCADPEDPCRLPNAFVSDPPLAHIVAGTWEAGARGARGALRWSVASFRTTVRDDIIFVSSGRLRGQGHFENVHRTYRTGLEAAAEYEYGRRAALSLSYGLQKATFGADLRVPSRLHPAAEEDGAIPVASGDRIPGVPLHTAKARLSVAISSRVTAAADAQARSGAPLRGDEANLLAEVPGFVRLDLHLRYRFGRHLSAAAHVSNLLDARAYTFGVLGDPSLVGIDPSDRGFYSPAPPRAAWFGLELGLNRTR